MPDHALLWSYPSHSVSKDWKSSLLSFDTCMSNCFFVRNAAFSSSICWIVLREKIAMTECYFVYRNST